MTEIEEILAEERARAHAPERPGPRRTIALVLGALAVGALVIGGTVVGVGASATIARTSAGDELPATRTVTSDASLQTATTPAAVAPAEGARVSDVIPPYGAIAVLPGGSPLFDGSADRDLLPPPPADWPQSELDNAKIWLDQQYIIADCMNEQSFDYTFTIWYLMEQSDIRYNGPAQSPEWKLALGGNTGGGDDYRWDEAGCQGYAVHVTGMDDAN